MRSPRREVLLTSRGKAGIFHGDLLPNDGGVVENGFSLGTPRASNEDTSQPEQEDFPLEVPTEEDPESMERGEPVLPHEVPVPDWETDREDVMFGDDVSVESSTQGVWEVEYSKDDWDVEVAEAFCEYPSIFEPIWLTTGSVRGSKSTIVVRARPTGSCLMLRNQSLDRSWNCKGGHKRDS